MHVQSWKCIAYSIKDTKAICIIVDETYRSGNACRKRKNCYDLAVCAASVFVQLVIVVSNARRSAPNPAHLTHTSFMQGAYYQTLASRPSHSCMRAIPACYRHRSFLHSKCRYVGVCYRLFLDLNSWIFEKTFPSKVMA